jgi:hypothetical protein
MTLRVVRISRHCPVEIRSGPGIIFAVLSPWKLIALPPERLPNTTFIRHHRSVPEYSSIVAQWGDCKRLWFAIYVLAQHRARFTNSKKSKFVSIP